MRSINLGGWLIVGGVTFVGACGDSPGVAMSGSSGSAGSTGEASTSSTGEASASSTGEASTAPTSGQSAGATGEASTSTTAEVSANSTGEPGSSTDEPGTSTGEPGTSTGEPGSSTDEPGTSTGEPGSSTGETGSTSMSEPPPDATALALSFSPTKQFDFSWAAAAGATYYQLLERPTPDLDYTQIGGDIVGESISRTMPLHLRFGASYILKACNTGGCTDSAPVEVVDSMAKAVGYLKASNPSGRFGYSVALSGDGNTLAVGALADANVGAVYVFTRTDTVWSQQAHIKASNPGAGDAFGCSVALSGDGNTLAVGAQTEDSASTGINGDQGDNQGVNAVNAGAAYVFTRTNDSWSQQAYIKASNAGGLDLFGEALALAADGNTLAVGARSEDGAAVGINGDQSSNGALDAGAVYVFVRANDVWSQEAYIKASNTDALDNFGDYLALSGDGNTLAVGASLEDSAATGINGAQADNAAPSSGAAYVFRRANKLWSQEAYIKASNAEPGDRFGMSVALSASGDTLAVGAYLEKSAASGINGDQADNSIGAAGAAYVLFRENDVWSQQAYVKPEKPDVSDFFGLSIALSANGNILAVGGWREDSAAIGIGGDKVDNSASDAGAVSLYERANNAWSTRAYVKASNTEAGDRFSARWISLSGDGNTLAVGASEEDSAALGVNGDQANNGAPGSGAVYLY